MSTSYRIYSNDGAGGPIDYSTPIGTTSGLIYNTSAIPVSSDRSYAVRAYDTVSGLEELNTDATVRIITDGSGIDRTKKPVSPIGLTAKSRKNGTAKIEWSQPPSTREKAATSFKVWKTVSPGLIDYNSSPDATLTGISDRYCSTILTGLTGGTTYLIAVRAVNANGDDGNTATVSVTGSVAGPNAVDEFSVVLI